jgi:uncharacterized protein (TIGR00725 family)
MGTSRHPYVSVVGGGNAPEEDRAVARKVGRALAEAGAVVVCGGLGGVMEAACAGAHEAGGLTVGILPGTDRAEVNPHVDVALPTGMGETRNALVVRAADAIVAVSGEYGTLSEIALALAIGVPVVGIGTWDLLRKGEADRGVVRAETAQDAVTLALALAETDQPKRR